MLLYFKRKKKSFDENNVVKFDECPPRSKNEGQRMWFSVGLFIDQNNVRGGQMMNISRTV